MLETTHALSGQRLPGTAGDHVQQQLLMWGQKCCPEAGGPAALPPGGPHRVTLTKLCASFRLVCLRSLNFLFFFFFTFWLHHSAHRIPVPGSGMEPSAAAVGAQRPNHLAVREVPGSLNHIRLQAHITRSSDLLTPELSWSRSNTQGSDMMSRCCGGPARLRLLRSMGS